MMIWTMNTHYILLLINDGQHRTAWTYNKIISADDSRASYLQKTYNSMDADHKIKAKSSSNSGRRKV